MGLLTAIALGGAALLGAGATIHATTRASKRVKTEMAEKASLRRAAETELVKKREALMRLRGGTRVFATAGGVHGEELMKTQVGRLGQIR